SGTIVDRRDHVFTTFFSFRALSASTLFRRGASTNGPFFSERPIGFLPCSFSRPYLSWPPCLSGRPIYLSGRPSLLIHPAQLDPLRAPYLPKTADRTGYPVRMGAER